MYQVSEQMQSQFKSFLTIDQVQQVLSFIEKDQDRTIADMCELVVIEAPTFQEEKRAEEMARRFRALGLEGVHIDRSGSTVGLRRGSGNGPKILIEGHLDTVFPFGTVKGVEDRGDGFLYAPGIGDDTRALAMMLCLIRAFNACDIKTVGDIYFVCTTGEEGLGGFKGMKGFLDDHPEIDISLSLDNNDMSLVVFEATASEGWEFTFRGIGGHAFGAFGEVANPLHAAARAVAKIGDIQVPKKPKTTYSVSNFHAGSVESVNAIVSEATIMMNFRSTDGEAFQAMKDQIMAAIEAGAREESERWGKDTITVESKCLDSHGVGKQDPHMPLVEAAYLSLENVGVEPVIVEGGSTNANVPIYRGIPALCMGRAYAPTKETKTIYNHSVGERFPVAGAYKAVQHAATILMMSAGLEGAFDPMMEKKA